MSDLLTLEGRAHLAALYRGTLLGDVMPFWLRHGMDRGHGGIMTSLDRDGTAMDTDKSVWFQGRAGWMFATLYLTVERRPEWLEAARSCVAFSRQHCHGPDGKMYFTVTREGRPLRMRRYVFSESLRPSPMLPGHRPAATRLPRRMRSPPSNATCIIHLNPEPCRRSLRPRAPARESEP